MEIKEMEKIIGDINSAFNELKSANDSNKAEIGEYKAKIEAVQTVLDELTEKYQKLNEANMPGFDTSVKSEKKETIINYIRKGYNDLSEKEKKALIVADDAEGGFTVDEEFLSSMIVAVPDKNVVIPTVTNITTSKGAIRVPKGNGGMVWYDVDEQNLPTESDPSFGQVLIQTHEHAGLITLSKDLLEDAAVNLEQYITGEFVKTLSTKVETDIFTGNGTSTKEGILTNTSIGAVTAASSTVLTMDDVINFLYELKEQYAIRGTVFARRKMVRNLRLLKDTTNNYLWMPPAVKGETATVDGMPILQCQAGLSENMTTGQKVMLVGDMSYYWRVARINMSIQRMNEKYAPLIGLLFRVREGGAVMLPEAFKVLKMK
mgnify:CR=1 FL=1